MASGVSAVDTNGNDSATCCVKKLSFASGTHDGSTTPMMSSSMCDSLGGLIIYVRARPSTETEFAQVLLPVALSYETFLCKLCVALGVERESVKKIVKLPDILIRSTEDVIRLTPFEKLELVLHNSLWKHKVGKKWRSTRPWCLAWFFATLMAVTLTTAVTCRKTGEILHDVIRRADKCDGRLLAIEEKLLKTNTGQQQPPQQVSINNDSLLYDSIVKRISTHIRTLETNLLEHLQEFDERFDRLNADYLSILNSLNSIDQTNKLVVKRKNKES